MPGASVTTMQASSTPSASPSPSPKGPNAAAQPEYILAEAEFKAGNNAAAVNDFNQAIQLDPTFLGSYLDRGNAEVKLGQLEDASVDFSRIIKADPNDASALANRGATYGQLGENALALADLRRADTLKPNDAGIEYNLASAEAQSGDVRRALTYMNLSVTHGPTAYAYRGRASLESALNDQAAAIKDMTAAIKSNAADPSLFAGRALYYQRAHQYKAALADDDAAIRLAPSVPDFRLMRAATRVLAKDTAGAIADLRFLRRMLSDAGNVDAVARIDHAIAALIAQSHTSVTPKPTPHAPPHH
jgi:tetratricopeptide (TPR) repeat protein